MRILGFVRHNAIALVALFIALGGTSYAALTINGSQIKNRSISAKKLERNSLGGAIIRESKLGKVPRARRADRLGKVRASDLKVRCPAGTEPISGICAELSTRAAASFGVARLQCGIVQRRLPTYEELTNLVSGAGIDLALPGELTSSVYLAGTSLRVVTVTSEAGAAGSVANSAATGTRPFRCVAYPSN